MHTRFLFRPLLTAISLFGIALIALPMSSQALPTSNMWGLEKGETPPFQATFEVSAMHANAPPTVCGCFWMFGGAGEGELNVTRHWSGVMNLSGVTASNINGTNQHLSVFNYLVGPRFHLRNRTAYTPYAHILLGGSEVFSNYNIYGLGRNYLAAQTGAGLDVRLSRHLSLIPVEANYVFSDAVNGVNSRQNNFKVSAGISFRID